MCVQGDPTSRSEGDESLKKGPCEPRMKHTGRCHDPDSQYRRPCIQPLQQSQAVLEPLLNNHQDSNGPRRTSATTNRVCRVAQHLVQREMSPLRKDKHANPAPQHTERRRALDSQYE